MTPVSDSFCPKSRKDFPYQNTGPGLSHLHPFFRVTQTSSLRRAREHPRDSGSFPSFLLHNPVKSICTDNLVCHTHKTTCVHCDGDLACIIAELVSVDPGSSPWTRPSPGYCRRNSEFPDQSSPSPGVSSLLRATVRTDYPNSLCFSGSAVGQAISEDITPRTLKMNFIYCRSSVAVCDHV